MEGDDGHGESEDGDDELRYADPTNPQSMNLYSYALNNPLSYDDPSGLAYCQWSLTAGGVEDRDDTYTGDPDEDQGAARQSDCSNGGGTWILEPGDPQAVQNADGDTGTLPTPSTTVTATGGNMEIDPDEARIDALVQGVAHDTRSFPWLCNGGISVRVGRKDSRFSVGLDASVRNGLQGTGAINLFNLGGVKGNFNVKGGNPGGNVNFPIPTTPFKASVNLTSKHPSVGIGQDVGIPKTNLKASVQIYFSFGYLGDTSCRN